MTGTLAIELRKRQLCNRLILILTALQAGLQRNVALAIIAHPCMPSSLSSRLRTTTVSSTVMVGKGLPEAFNALPPARQQVYRDLSQNSMQDAKAQRAALALVAQDT